MSLTYYESEAAALRIFPRNTPDDIPAGWRSRGIPDARILCRFYDPSTPLPSEDGSQEGSDDESPERDIFLPITSSNDFRPPQDSVMMAANHLVRWFEVFREAHDCVFALVGGVAIKMHTLDERRITQDVDVKFKGNKSHLFNALTTTPSLPGFAHNRLISVNAYRFFMSVGRDFGDALPHNNLIKIEVLDGLFPVQRGPLDWRQHIAEDTVILHKISLTAPRVGVMSLLDGKLRTYAVRKARRDFIDVKILLRLYGEEIAPHKKQLDYESRRYLLFYPPYEETTDDIRHLLFDRLPTPPSDESD